MMLRPSWPAPLIRFVGPTLITSHNRSKMGLPCLNLCASQRCRFKVSFGLKISDEKGGYRCYCVSIQDNQAVQLGSSLLGFAEMRAVRDSRDPRDVKL